MEAKMSKFEIKLSDNELKNVELEISLYKFPGVINKQDVAIDIFGSCSDWNIRKVREAVSRLQEKGYPIIAHHGGYSVFGDDPQPVIEYLNREYHRVYEATKKNDQIFHALKQKYGDAVAKKVEQLPGESWLDITDDCLIQKGSKIEMRLPAEPPFRKSIDARGNEIALQFEADA